MSDATAFVQEATKWARELVHQEARGPGDYTNAIARIARRLRLSKGSIWALLYRPPKTVQVHVFYALGEAIDEQRLRYREERKETIATTAFGRVLLSASAALVREKDGGLGE